MVHALQQTARIGALCFLSLGALAEPGDDPDPLFLSDGILTASITAPFKSVMKDRESDEDVPASFQYADETGAIFTVDVGIQTRGHFRRSKDVCKFAPLRLNFKKSDVKDTEFDKQDKLKLVTHCNKYPRRYQQTVVAEYLAYRILNILTDNSFRARLLHITYIDSDDKFSEFESFAVLIEHDNRLAARTGLPVVKVEMADIYELRPDFTNLASVFHYLIGNTDYSPKATSPNTKCCHNHRLFANEGELYYSIPFDFDMSGLVDAPHASPNDRFQLDDVTERLYRGRCEFNDQLPETLQLFREQREKIELLVEQQEELDNRTRKTMLRYIEEFYDTLDKPKQVNREFVKKCI